MASAAIAMQAPAVSDWGILSVALAPASVGSVIATDTSLAGSSSAGVNTLTKSMTLGSSANYLLVGVIGDNTSDKITGVTYNAVAMTQLVKVYPGSSVSWLYLYGLANPTTGGAHNIVVSASGACSNIGVEAQSYTNCAVSQPNVSTSASFRSVSIAWTVLVPLQSGCWGVSFMRFSSSGVPTFQSVAGTGTVASLRVSQNNSTSDLASIVDTNGTIPLLTAVALNPNSAQWRVQRIDVSRRREEKVV